MNPVTKLDMARRQAIAPAIGPGSLVSGRPFVARLLLLVVALGVCLGTLVTKAAKDAAPLPALRGTAYVTPHIIRGSQPTDYDLLQLRNGFGVQAVVNLRLSGSQEGEVAAGFGLDYLALPLAHGEVLNAQQLATLVAVIRRHQKESGVVYLHDDIGGGRVLTTAAMLLLLRGQPLDTVLSAFSADELKRLSAVQLSALQTLSRALNGDESEPTRAYQPARELQW
jgi:protein-tyrosine phosphatase